MQLIGNYVTKGNPEKPLWMYISAEMSKMRSHQTWTWGTWGIWPELQMKVKKFSNDHFTTKLIQSGTTLCCENGIDILRKFHILRRDNAKCLYVKCYKVHNSFSNGSAKGNKHINRKRKKWEKKLTLQNINNWWF